MEDVRGGEVRMGELRHEREVVLEVLQLLWTRLDQRVHALQREQEPRDRVLREIDHAEAAPAELANELVLVYATERAGLGPTDHRGQRTHGYVQAGT